MSKETSEEIAKLAGDLGNITAAELTGLSPEEAEAIASKIRRVSMSAVSQRQVDPD